MTSFRNLALTTYISAVSKIFIASGGNACRLFTNQYRPICIPVVFGNITATKRLFHFCGERVFLCLRQSFGILLS